MRRLTVAVLLTAVLIGGVLSTSAGASVSRTVDYLSLAGRTYAVTTPTVDHRDIEAGAGAGYWLLASDGGVFAFGDAKFAGSAAGVTSHAIVGMAKTKTGKGYWLAASDGGVFAFGDAKFYGSVPGLVPKAEGEHVFAGIAAAGDGNGYYLYDRHGHVYAFGSAKFMGSPAGSTQDRPVTALAVSTTGNGYYMMDIRGSLWGYGDVGGNDVNNYVDYAKEPWSKTGRVHLSAVGSPNVYAQALDGSVIPGYYNTAAAPSRGEFKSADFPMTGFATTPAGYYEAAADGSVFSFGDAKFWGSLPQKVSSADLVAPIIGITVSGPAS